MTTVPCFCLIPIYSGDGRILRHNIDRNCKCLQITSLELDRMRSCFLVNKSRRWVLNIPIDILYCRLLLCRISNGQLHVLYFSNLSKISAFIETLSVSHDVCVWEYTITVSSRNNVQNTIFIIWKVSIATALTEKYKGNK